MSKEVDVLSELAGAALGGVRSLTMAAQEGLQSEADDQYDRIAGLANMLVTEIGTLLGDTLNELVSLAGDCGWPADEEATQWVEKAMEAFQQRVACREKPTAEYPEWSVYADRLYGVFQAVQNARVDVEHLRDRD